MKLKFAIDSSGYLRDYRPQTDAIFPILSNSDIIIWQCGECSHKDDGKVFHTRGSTAA